ncbi:hypothetical protein [Loigolactobacillus iwatensis]|uniref:hypothetical protein n=1 Tax=Loigolactobacillus iwatensis TaxID=1267156 RepID=UPI000F7F57FF|nr:hypothetical protein [Loigolactobacillus iwatensis]
MIKRKKLFGLIFLAFASLLLAIVYPNQSVNANIRKYDNRTVKVQKMKTYKVGVTDTAWAGTHVKISRVKVVKFKKFKDPITKKTYHGYVAVKMSVNPTQRDISFNPTLGSVLTSDGQQVDADGFDSGSWDGDLDKGVKRSGTVYFNLTKLKNPKKIKSIRLKWDADYETDDVNDNNANKTYDITVNLH